MTCTNEGEKTRFGSTAVGWKQRALNVGLAICLLSACSDTQESSSVTGTVQQGINITIFFRNGQFPSPSYAGATDTWIRQSEPNTNFGTSTSCYAAGDTDGGSFDRSCLIRWDVSSIPANATVISAKLHLTVHDQSPSEDDYQVTNVIRSWDGVQATWMKSAFFTSWQQSGALGNLDRGLVPIGIVPGDGAPGIKVVQLNAAGRDVVQTWVSSSSPNNGIIISNTTADDNLRLVSSDSPTIASRPMLEVEYALAQGGVGGWCGACGGLGGRSP